MEQQHQEIRVDNDSKQKTTEQRIFSLEQGQQTQEKKIENLYSMK